MSVNKFAKCKKRFIRIVSFFVILILNNNFIQSQPVSVELSMGWEKNYSSIPRRVISKMKSKLVPYLSITYRNNSDSDIYFLKLINNYNHFPTLGNGMLAGKFDKKATLDYFPYYGYTSKSFFVSIQGSEIFEGEWKIMTDSAIYNNIEDDLLDGILGDFYFAIREDSNIDTMASHISFKKEDTSDSAIKNNKQCFGFLKKGEALTDQFNLIGFYLLGGEYVFYLKEQSFINYIITDQPEAQKVYLPIQVNGYKLYMGAFKSNSMRIKFEKKSN